MQLVISKLTSGIERFVSIAFPLFTSGCMWIDFFLLFSWFSRKKDNLPSFFFKRNKKRKMFPCFCFYILFVLNILYTSELLEQFKHKHTQCLFFMIFIYIYLHEYEKVTQRNFWRLKHWINIVLHTYLDWIIDLVV